MTDIPITTKSSYGDEFNSWKNNFITRIVYSMIEEQINKWLTYLLSIPSSQKINDGLGKCITQAEITGRIKALQDLLNIKYTDIDDNADLLGE